MKIVPYSRETSSGTYEFFKESVLRNRNYMNGIIDKAVAQANAEHIHGKAITPYLLAHIKDMTEGKSFAANLELAYNNAHAASKIAVAYSKL